MTKVLLYLLQILLFFGALLGINFEEMCGSPAPTPSPSPAETVETAPPAEAQPPAEAPPPAEPALDRAAGGCPAGLCVVGRTGTIPPHVICGACRTAVERQPKTSCPKVPAPGSVVYLNNKPYGHGFDSTVRVKGDPEFCYLIHGVVINDCHLEGWPKRVQCEMELLKGCPIWQYTVDGTTVHGCFDDRGAAASCDHFGSVGHQDDPQTPTTGDSVGTLRGFEGLPLQCGLQRNALGPMAGFFTVAHGIGNVRACKPNGAGCGPWRPFDH